jgi:hypothetical protein
MAGSAPRAIAISLQWRCQSANAAETTETEQLNIATKVRLSIFVGPLRKRQARRSSHYRANKQDF